MQAGDTDCKSYFKLRRIANPTQREFVVQDRLVVEHRANSVTRLLAASRAISRSS